MTSDEYYKMEIEKLEEKIKTMTNLVQHLRNKFLNIADCVDQKGSQMINHIVEYIDEIIKPVNSEENSEIGSKFTKKLIYKMSKD